MDTKTVVATTRAMLRARPRTVTYRRIHEETGIGLDWLAKFASGAISEPGAGRLETLRQYLTECDAASGLGMTADELDQTMRRMSNQ